MKQKFVIMTNPRTGSEYLAKLLDNHTQVTCLGEVFSIGPDGEAWNYSKYKQQGDMFGYLDYEFSKSDKPICGYKQISNWLENAGYPKLEAFIQAHHERQYRFIFLSRENLLKEYVSFMLMMQKGYGHISEEQKQKLSVHLEPRVAYMYMRKWIGFNKRCKEILNQKQIPYLDLLYERDFAKDKKVKEKVFDFFSLPYEEIVDPLKQTNPYQLEELIDNYDEVCKYLKDKGWEEHIKK